jgi:hypothetical protein
MLKTKLFVSCCISEEARLLILIETNIEFLPKIFPHRWRSNAWILQVSPKMLLLFVIARFSYFVVGGGLRLQTFSN